jgi:hypothetical protein
MYNPGSTVDRIKLAGLIELKLIDCGFKKEDTGRFQEYAYSRNISDDIKVLVYTTIIEIGGTSQVRPVSKDALRICGVYYDGDVVNRGIVKQKRVNRTGEFGEIVGRMYERMRDTWRLCANVEKCSSCGAPKFTSKKENLVCARACWTKNE